LPGCTRPVPLADHWHEQNCSRRYCSKPCSARAAAAARRKPAALAAVLALFLVVAGCVNADPTPGPRFFLTGPRPVQVTSPAARPGPAWLTWTPAAGAVSYRLYLGQNSHDYSVMVECTAPPVLVNLDWQPTYCTATVVFADDVESDLCPESIL
jgi:hypothetical protein